MAHTPGEWVCDCNYRDGLAAYIFVKVMSSEGPTDDPVAEVYGGDNMHDNARLICAASDMYQALLFARSVIKSGEPWTETCEVIINAALAKARGDEIVI